MDGTTGAAGSCADAPSPSNARLCAVRSGLRLGQPRTLTDIIDRQRLVAQPPRTRSPPGGLPISAAREPILACTDHITGVPIGMTPALHANAIDSVRRDQPMRAVCDVMPLRELTHLRNRRMMISLPHTRVEAADVGILMSTDDALASLEAELPLAQRGR